MDIDISASNKILIIQPDEQVREMLVEVFKNSGFEVMFAGDGAEGFSKINNQGGVDVILTALNMPRMDALEFIKRKKENPALVDTPVVIYDNLNSEEEKELVLKAGAKDFIAKGAASPAEIIQKVSRAMQQGDYLLQIDPYALDAQPFIENYHLNKNFECDNCGSPLAIKLRAYKGRDLTAKIVCPNCGKEYL
jgi:CheY-like chemotaxis protein/predicted RNA-binding Zn-ribbon protein involved in translation (DUF1610 family)